MTTSIWSPERRKARGLIAATALTLVLAACGNPDDTAADDAPPAPSLDESSEVNALLPQAIRDAGAIKVATDATYPPMEFFEADGKTMTGFDIDLGQAISDVAGVELQFTNLAFPSIITAMKGGRFDMTITAISDIPERRDVVTFVDYFNVGSNLMVASGNPAGVSDFVSLCGKKLGIQAGTTQLIDAEKRQSDCTSAGEPEMDISTFDTNDAANLALSSGRVDAVYAQSIVNAYVVSKASSKYEVVGDEYNQTPLGIAIPKENQELVEAMQAAVQAVIDSGAYDAILEKYGLESGAIETATINDGA